MRQEKQPNIGIRESRSPGWDPRVAGTSVSWLFQMPDPAAHLKTTGPRATDKCCRSQGLVLHLPAEATVRSPPDLSLIHPFSSEAPRKRVHLL